MAEVDVELDNLLSNFKLDKGVEDLTLDELLANLNTDVDIDEIEEISRVLGETKFKLPRVVEVLPIHSRDKKSKVSISSIAYMSYVDPKEPYPVDELVNTLIYGFRSSDNTIVKIADIFGGEGFQCMDEAHVSILDDDFRLRSYFYYKDEILLLVGSESTIGYDFANRNKLFEIPHLKERYLCDQVPIADGRFYHCYNEGEVYEYDIMTGIKLRNWTLKLKSKDFDFNGAFLMGNVLYVAVNKSIYQLDFSTGQFTKVIDLPKGHSANFLLGYDNHLVVADDCTKGSCWNTQTKKMVWETKKMGNEVMLRDGVLYGTASGVVYATDFKTGKNLWAGLNNCTSEPMYVDAAKAVYNFSKDQVFKMESTTSEILWKKSSDDVTSDYVRILGSHVFLATPVQQFSLEDGTLYNQESLESGYDAPFLVTKSGQLITSKSDKVRLWNFTNWKEEVGMFKFTKDIGSDEYWDPTCLALSEDEKCLFTACNDSKTFHQWNIATQQIVTTFKASFDVQAIAVMGKVVLVGGAGQFSQFSIDNGKEMNTIRLQDSEAKVRKMVCHAGIVYVLASGNLYSWKPGTTDIKEIAKGKCNAGDLAIYHNTLFLCRNTIQILDLDTFELKLELSLPDKSKVQSIDIQEETMVVVTTECNFFCVSLLLLGAKRRYIEAIGNWDKFLEAIKDEQIWNFRDSRENNFYSYMSRFAPDDYFEYLVDKSLLKHHDYFEPNKYYTSPFTIALTTFGDVRNNIEAHYDEEKDKYLMKDEKYVAHLTSILLKYMHQGEGWNKVDTVKEYIKKENVMEISYELLSACVQTTTPKELKDFVENLKTVDFISTKTKNSLVHDACNQGDVKLLEQLLAMDNVNPNLLNSAGDTPLQLAVRPPSLGNTTLSYEEEEHDSLDEILFTSTGPTYTRRLACANMLLKINSVSKKPNIFHKNNEGVTAYDSILYGFDYASRQMKRVRDEIKDRTAIQQSKDLFTATNETLDIIHDNYEQSGRKRRRFAIKMFLAEAIHYVIFLVLLASLAFLNFSRNDQHDYYFSKGISDALDAGLFSTSASIEFSSIVREDQFFEWLDNTLIPTVYQNVWYNNETYTAEEQFYVAQYNRFVGSIRLKQVRTTNHECKPSSSMKDAVPFCYTKEPIISKEAYGPGLIYVWSDDSEDSGFESSFDHRQYASGGFIQDITLDMDMAQANSVVDTLKANKWIDKSTRVVLVSLTVYNPNMNRLGATQMMLEYLVGGEAFPSVSITPLKAKNIGGGADVAQVIIEILCIVYIGIEFLYREITEIQKHWREDNIVDNYLLQSWNYYEWSIILLSIVVAIFRIMNRISLSILDYTPAGPYTNVLSLANNVIAERALFSILIVFCYLRGLKLLRIPPFTGPVTQSIMDTLKARTVLVFLGLFIIIIFSFSIAFSVAFASDIYGYRTIGNSFITLIRMAFGDINYDELEQSNYFLGPLLFITFIFFITLIMMNLVVAILSEVYIAIQDHNEDVWERSITKMWIENKKPNGFFLTKGIAYSLHYINAGIVLLRQKLSRGSYVENSGEERMTQVRYEDDDLDSFADEMREKRVTKSTNDIFGKVESMDKDMVALKTQMETMLKNMQEMSELMSKIAKK